MESRSDVNQLPSLWAFIASVDWTDPWLVALLTFHSLVTVTAVTTRHQTNLQATLFVVLLSLVYFSETINEIAARNWRLFSRQQYFDQNGMFISVVFSIPLLLNCLLMVINWLYTSGVLMIQIKQAQLRKRVRKDRNERISEDKCNQGNVYRRGAGPSDS